jgi:hypothetical protein
MNWPAWPRAAAPVALQAGFLRQAVCLQLLLLLLLLLAAVPNSARAALLVTATICVLPACDIIAAAAGAVDADCFHMHRHQLRAHFLSFVHLQQAAAAVEA